MHILHRPESIMLTRYTHYLDTFLAGSCQSGISGEDCISLTFGQSNNSTAKGAIKRPREPRLWWKQQSSIWLDWQISRSPCTSGSQNDKFRRLRTS